jgi:5-methylcytosine-specific restriction endonuclease McrA
MKKRIDFINLSNEEFEKYRLQFIKNALRKASYRWPYRYLAVKKAAHPLERGIRTCAACKDRFHYKKVKLDHIKPVVDPKTGYKGLDTYAKRLLVRESGWQVLCDVCHQSKTKKENKTRRKRATIKRG